MSIDGFLNINKPAGKTSFKIVTLVRRVSGERRVGHGGTLDPLATGVLVIGLGQGTRLLEYLVEAKKSYRAEVELGVETDTYDAAGRVTRRGDVSSVTREQVEAAFWSFRGFIEQIPPMYSAVKHEGTPLYRLARAGIEVPRRSRRVNIFKLEMVNWDAPVATLEVECSKGTYIRSLAHDLGQVLGCGAYLRNLVRLKSGPFDIREGITVPQLEDAFRCGYWQSLIHPVDVVLLNLTAAIVSRESELAIQNGRPVALGVQSSHGNAERCRAYSIDGRIIAVLRFQPEKGLWQPEKVLSMRTAK